MIASQNTAKIDDESESIATPVSLRSQVTINDATHAIRFQALNPETGKPEQCSYIMRRGNGAQYGGITSQDGFTEIIETTGQEQIGIHFVFKSPSGKIITREDLTV